MKAKKNISAQKKLKDSWSVIYKNKKYLFEFKFLKY